MRLRRQHLERWGMGCATRSFVVNEVSVSTNYEEGFRLAVDE